VERVDTQDRVGAAAGQARIGEVGLFGSWCDQVHEDGVHAPGLGRRRLHCRGREPAPGTPSRRVVAEGTLIGK
jgi:hypothetical protein